MAASGTSPVHLLCVLDIKARTMTQIEAVSYALDHNTVTTFELAAFHLQVVSSSYSYIILYLLSCACLTTTTSTTSTGKLYMMPLAPILPDLTAAVLIQAIQPIHKPLNSPARCAMGSMGSFHPQRLGHSFGSLLCPFVAESPCAAMHIH